ncbi:hypothetical protein HPA02_12560 [Bisbaumannia pacifica]|uniref:DUF1722 domain-containing protein n=1 Tax=Bisbaumannia pacifica TaxID=77098 RepID=A0A510X6B4_9GAMM|nr:DUF1722 domain-containing protein [Halomonas pacifica]GEK46973.1 hypothetical protein HPA02_12560 [Halomonas pacifica]
MSVWRVEAWDLSPAYLNRRELLWAWHARGTTPGGRARLAAELWGRGERVALLPSGPVAPEEACLDPQRIAEQLAWLAAARRWRTPGRLPPPLQAQRLWRQHKYSVMARSPRRYRQIGREVAALPRGVLPTALALELSEWLLTAPTPGGLRNAVQHLWGYVAEVAPPARGEVDGWTSARLLRETRDRALHSRQPYLLESTALGELAAWLPEEEMDR